MKKLMMNKMNAKILSMAALSLGVTALTMGSVALTACTPKTPTLSKEPNVELVQDMMDQPALKAQDDESSSPSEVS